MSDANFPDGSATLPLGLLPACSSSEHNLMEASTRRCPAVSSFGGIVLSQCGAACV